MLSTVARSTNRHKNLMMGTRHGDSHANFHNTQISKSLEDGEVISEMSLFKLKRIVLNVGGNKFDITWKNLEKLPNSRLGKIRFAKSLEEVEALCDEIDIEKNEIYFDRPSNSFRPSIF